MLYTQYSNATNLQNLFKGTEAYKGLNEILSISVEHFHRDYFDIDTCNSQGLINWGRILDLNNAFYLPDYNNSFGFGDIMGLPPPPEYPQNFNHGAFWEGKQQNLKFTDAQYRILLKLKYRIITSNFSYQSITDILNRFVNSININYRFNLQVIDKMTVNYLFNFYFTEEEILYFYILTSGFLLPVPNSINYSILFGQTF